VFYFMTLSRVFVIYLSIKYCFFCDSSLWKIALKAVKNVNNKKKKQKSYLTGG